MASKFTAEMASLTRREIEVIKLLATGSTVKDVAKKLGISAKTADVHKTNLMRKLDIHNRAKLTIWAVKTELVKV